MAPILFSTFLEKDRGFLTRRNTLAAQDAVEALNLTGACHCLCLLLDAVCWEQSSHRLPILRKWRKRCDSNHSRGKQGTNARDRSSSSVTPTRFGYAMAIPEYDRSLQFWRTTDMRDALTSRRLVQDLSYSGFHSGANTPCILRNVVLYLWRWWRFCVNAYQGLK